MISHSLDHSLKLSSDLSLEPSLDHMGMRTEFNLARIRKDFPILQRSVRGKPLVYLDNAATTLKPRSVVEAVKEHYLHGAANVHRGLHFLSEEATRLYEDAREKVR